jgi:hypothetical protein
MEQKTALRLKVRLHKLLDSKLYYSFLPQLCLLQTKLGKVKPPINARIKIVARSEDNVSLLF